MSNNGFAVERDPLFNENNLIWMDLEMTGLEPQINRILEMAAVITDPQLNVIAEGPVVAIHQDAAILSGMDSWNTATHTRSGLVNRCLESKVTEDEAAQIFIDFFSKYVPAGKSPLCGNSIGQDRRFMARWTTRLEQFFHYRNLDVSSFKECVKRWAPEVMKKYQKTSRHEALSDIYDSVEELRFYRQEIMKI